MKRFYIFLLLLTMGVCGFAQGLTTITIGTGTTETYNLPINNFYKNSWSEMIYPASQITETGYITSISFDVSAVPSGDFLCSTLTIYMGETSEETHSSNSEWLPMDALTEVYSASDWPLPTTTGWLTFDLDNPFPYSGDNLVIVVSKTMPNYTNALKFHYTAAANSCLYRRSDNNPDDYAGHPGTNTGTFSNQLPNLQLTISSTMDFCHSVTNLSATDITSNSATIFWHDEYSTGHYILQYKDKTESWNDAVTVTVYDTTYVQVPYAVHDTTYIDNYIHDTTVVTNMVYDTTYIQVPYAVHDTTYIDNYIHDTTVVTNTVYDTTYVQVPYAVHDTTYISVPYAVHDTTYIDNYIHDTTVVTNTIYDTTYVTQYDTVLVDVLVHDTLVVTDTVTVELEMYTLMVSSADETQGFAAGIPCGALPHGRRSRR